MPITLLDVGDGSYLSVEGGSGIVYAPEIVTQRFSLAWPNRADEAVISGLGWNPLFPLSRLQNPVYDLKARSLTMSVDPLVFTFPKLRRIGLITLPRHNMTNAAQWRVRLYYDAARTILQWDSGWMYVWPQIYTFDELNFEDDNWWSLNIANEDRALYTALAVVSADQNYLTGAATVEISDPYNADGVFNIGRAFMAPVWQPAVNMSYGVKYGSEIDTKIERVLSGGPRFEPKPGERTIAAPLDYLTHAEGFQLRRAIQTQGLHREVFVCDDLTVDRTFMDRAFMGRFIETSPLTHPLLSTYAATVAVQEFV